MPPNTPPLAAQHTARLGMYVLAAGAVVAGAGPVLGLAGALDPLLIALFGGMGVEAFGILLDRASDPAISNKDLLAELQALFETQNPDGPAHRQKG